MKNSRTVCASGSAKVAERIFDRNLARKHVNKMKGSSLVASEYNPDNISERGFDSRVNPELGDGNPTDSFGRLILRPGKSRKVLCNKRGVKGTIRIVVVVVTGRVIYAEASGKFSPGLGSRK